MNMFSKTPPLKTKLDQTLKGTAYYEQAITRLWEIFEHIQNGLNNREGEFVNKRISQGMELCSIVTGTLKCQTDKITITMCQGNIAGIHGCPSSIEIEVVDTMANDVLKIEKNND